MAKDCNRNIAVLLYLVTLGITLYISMTKGTIVSDQLSEWNLYQNTIRDGQWHFVPDNIVNSSVLSVFISAWVQKFTHLPEALVFWAYPCLFLSLAPPFIYLISRKYIGVKLSILASLFVMTNWYIIAIPYLGRVSIAFGLYPVLMWAVMDRRYVWGVISALLINFAHYGTAYMVAILLGVCLIVIIVTRAKKMIFPIAIPLVVLLMAIGVWHFGIAKESGRYGVQFAYNSVASVTDEIKSSQPVEHISVLPSNINIPSPNEQSFWNLNRREVVVQEAFGASLPHMNNLQRLEFVLNWVIVLLGVMGVTVAVFNRKLILMLRVSAILMFLACVATVVIPYFSLYYGIGRIWYYFLIVTTPFVFYYLYHLVGNRQVIAVIMVSLVTLGYGLFTSGIL